MATRRQRQVSKLLQEELSQLIQQRLKDPRLGFVTVTDVEVSADLRTAQVFVSLLGGPERETLQVLARSAGFLRHELGQTLTLRYIPALTFHVDHSVDYGLQIDALLDELDLDPADSGPETPDE